VERVLKSRKLIITSYNFFPENTPRAFRTFELAKEFSRRGYEIFLFIPEYNFEYDTLERRYNQKIFKTKTGFLLNRNGKVIRNRNSGVPSRVGSAVNLKAKMVVKELLHQIIPEANRFEYGITLSTRMAEISGEKFDGLISIAMPFCSHWGSVLGRVRNNIEIDVMIAEYGDPFYENRAYNNFYRHLLFEKMVMRYFDYIVVPDKIAVDSYLRFKNRENIKVIPQGLRFEDVRVAEYRKNVPITFGFAGNLYKKIRDPRSFLDYLTTIDSEFKFIIYTNMDNSDTRELLQPYFEKLGRKMVVNHKISRFNCIYELSKMDFLINFENESVNQVPSKLIDYGLSGRPILSFKSSTFSRKIFEQFMEGRYENEVKIDLTPFRIENVCDRFEELLY
jgi:hypothetical protein